MTSASRFFALALAAGCSALVLASDTGSPAGVAPQAAARQARSAAPAPSAARYLEYARASADWAWDRREESLARWRAQFDPESPFGYRPPGGLLETALVYSYLYEKEGTPRYAERAREILLTYGDYRNGVPRLGREEAARLRPRRARPSRLLRRDALPARLRRAAPPRQAVPARGRVDRGDGRPLDRLPAADVRVGHDEPDRPACGVARVGGEGAAEPPQGRRLGEAAEGARRRQLGQLGDRGRDDLPRRVALRADGVRRRPRPARRALQDAGGLLLRALLPEPDVAGERGARFRRRGVDAELAALLRVLRGGRGAARGSGDGVGRAADRRAIRRLLDADERGAGLLPAGQLSLGRRRPPAGCAEGPQRRGDGRRPGQEDRLPQRLGSRVDLPPPELPRRGRRRDELPRLPARLASRSKKRR